MHCWYGGSTYNSGSTYTLVRDDVFTIVSYSFPRLESSTYVLLQPGTYQATMTGRAHTSAGTSGSGFIHVEVRSVPEPAACLAVPYAAATLLARRQRVRR